eukprot:Cvel_20308.t2-p1 / transcript=Cvel_20308.t2 / gene=Cvel_20308 / organism=Chromera_velia_CCMP2878 / gene_product=hypothetical protein / transcript_product=hypothetical protein / location=Cvel_scaffold1813:1828-5524(+) / protein_length=278 / sequence_SO=supercontig / SO=protein_coding / is_pseudo=false
MDEPRVPFLRLQFDERLGFHSQDISAAAAALKAHLFLTSDLWELKLWDVDSRALLCTRATFSGEQQKEAEREKAATGKSTFEVKPPIARPLVSLISAHSAAMKAGSGKKDEDETEAGGEEELGDGASSSRGVPRRHTVVSRRASVTPSLQVPGNRRASVGTALTPPATPRPAPRILDVCVFQHRAEVACAFDSRQIVIWGCARTHGRGGDGAEGAAVVSRLSGNAEEKAKHLLSPGREKEVSGDEGEIILSPSVCVEVEREKGVVETLSAVEFHDVLV